MTDDGQRITDDVGLCRTCRWARIVTNRRGSTFFRCGRAETDARFPRYPPLPVLRCAGYEQPRLRETPLRAPARRAGATRLGSLLRAPPVPPPRARAPPT